jgi:hypothetical protein
MRPWCVALTLAAYDSWLNFEALPGINRRLCVPARMSGDPAATESGCRRQSY